MTKKIIISFLLFIIMLVPLSDLTAQKQDLTKKRPVGTEFWLCFMKNFLKQKTKSSTNKLNLELFVTGDDDANVKVEIKALNFSKEVFVPGGTVRNIKISPKAEIASFEQIEEDFGVHITSDNPISVYGLNTRYQTTDTYLGLPVNVLGNEYRIMSYNVAGELKSSFAIVATEDKTVINILPTTQTLGGKEAGSPFVIKLDKGDVYQVGTTIESVNANADLTGTYISSNKKIAVYGGHQCAYVPKSPSRIIACNHLVEQLPPVSSWGKHFYIGKMQNRSEYTYRVLAHKDETKLFLDGKLVRTLRAGEYFEADTNANIQITASEPVLTAQFSQGYKNGDFIGDPMMLLISPTQQFLKKYRFATPVNGSWNHYINVVVPTDNIDSLKLDGEKVNVLSFTQLGISRYSIAHLKIPYGTHFIKCNVPFGLYSYGFGFGEDAYDAYGSMGGQSFFEYVNYRDSIPPSAEILEDGTLVFRDDKVDDTGLKYINVLSELNLNAEVPSFIAGTPQLKVNYKAADPLEQGEIVFETADNKNNISYYTLCYTYSSATGELYYDLNRGKEVNCMKEGRYSIGLFGKVSQFYHYTDFSETDGIISNGNFSDATGSGGLGGVILTRILNDYFTVSLTVSMEKYGGTLISPDSVLGKIRDPQTGQLQDFQESHEISLNGYFLHSMITAEYYMSRYLYLTAGFNTAINLSEFINHQKRILKPEEYVYDNGKETINVQPDNLSSLRSFRLGVVSGIGIKVPFMKNYSIFGRGLYTYHISNLINDGGWNLDQFSILLGINYHF